MRKSDLISVYMEMEYGQMGPLLMKKLVNEAMDQGEWQDGFDIAVSIGELNNSDSTKLYQTLKKAYPEVVFDKDTIDHVLDKELPQSHMAPITWLVDTEGSIIMTDSLSVAKILDNQLIWVTDRVSWDGICLHKIENTVLIAEWFDVTRNDGEWCPLKIAMLDGTLLEGQIIESRPHEMGVSKNWFHKLKGILSFDL